MKISEGLGSNLIKDWTVHAKLLVKNCNDCSINSAVPITAELSSLNKAKEGAAPNRAKDDYGIEELLRKECMNLVGDKCLGYLYQVQGVRTLKC